MTESTKNSALKKLEKTIVQMGYPEKFKDYSPLKGMISANNSYLRNIRHCNKYNLKIGDIDDLNTKFDKLGGPDMPTFEVNAMTRSDAFLFFPAAILQPPFFYPANEENPYGDPAMNFGAIGSVIGHEISHGFDNRGRKYDADGVLTDWWTKHDDEYYLQNARKLINQFNNYTYFGGKVDGNRTLNENIADLGGVIVRY